MNNKIIEQPLISEQLLKLYSNISRNVDIVKVLPYVILAQKFYIEPILGSPLYEDLQKQISKKEELGVEITPEYQGLLLKVAPVLALYVDYLSIRPLAYSITEKGITKQNSENSSSIDADELGQYMLDIKNKAEMAAKLLVDYLSKCDLYPLYRPNCDIKTDTSLIIDRSSIYFPKKCNCK